MGLSFYNHKKVLVTGHTGFKGSWLVSLLLSAGAEVTGYALPAPEGPSLFNTLGLGEKLGDHSVYGDIRDLDHLMQVFRASEPELVFHLAAQPIVRVSYQDPVGTYSANVLGTVHVLECVRQTPSVRSFLNVTTDKVYENFEWDRGYREDDRLDGYDPYSNSKSCSELVTHSYRLSFFGDKGPAVSTARSGNVIGGGDFQKDRILPDCIRAAEAGREIILRNPDSTRPYQHVLEPLCAYLMIAEAQYRDRGFQGAYNVGPDDDSCLTTGYIADLFCKYYGEGARWVGIPDGGPHEAHLLKLDNTKLKETFGWKPVWSVEEAVEHTVMWTKAADKQEALLSDIRAFREKSTYL